MCEAAGILGARLHDLRHTYASVLASAGLSLPVIGALLGRTEASTTHGETHDRQCRCVKQMRRLRRQVCRARPIWLSRRRNVENRLYRAVSTGELPVYGWPAQLDEAGLHIELAPQDVTAIDPAIILAVKPLHGGLSTGSLGLRPSMTTRLASKGVGEFPLPDCLVLFRLAEFHSWAEIERLTGNWPSQLNRGMKLTGRRGRPQRVLDRAVALTRRRIDEGDWSISEPVSTLAQIANHQLAEEGERPISEGYVRSGG